MARTGWVNINYFLIEALQQVGEDQLALELIEKTLDMIKAQKGMFEFYNSENGNRERTQLPFLAGPQPFSSTWQFKKIAIIRKNEFLKGDLMVNRMGFPPTEKPKKNDNNEFDLNTFSNWHVIIASNRGPVVNLKDQEGQIIQQKGSGGLITGLSGIIQYINATWISCAQSPEDIDFDAGDISLVDTAGDIHVKFIDPQPEAYDGYYNVIANPLLWFLQHSMWNIPSEPVIDHETWQAWENGYKEVNRLFAKEIVSTIRSSKKIKTWSCCKITISIWRHAIFEKCSPNRKDRSSHYLFIFHGPDLNTGASCRQPCARASWMGCARLTCWDSKQKKMD